MRHFFLLFFIPRFISRFLPCLIPSCFTQCTAYLVASFAVLLLSGCAINPWNDLTASRLLESPTSKPSFDGPDSLYGDFRKSLSNSLGDSLGDSAGNTAGNTAGNSLRNELSDWALLGANAHTKAVMPTPVVIDSNKAPATEHPLITVQLISAPIEQVLHQLAYDAQLGMRLHQPMTGNVTLLADRQPLEALLAQVALQVPLYWQIDNGVLQLWGDHAFTKSYAVDYLNIDRSTRSRVGLATQVGTINAQGDEAGGGVANSSQTLLENSADHHFWHSLAVDLDGLVGSASNDANYTLNRDAGMVTLTADASLHRKLESYLYKLNDNAQRQVLIEATVVEVALSNKFQSGIDWQLLSDKATGVNAAQVLSGSPQVTADSINRITAPNGLLSLVQKSKLGNITATLNLLEQFGDVRILSKPRIIALNNQTSVLKVVDNRVYFTVNVERLRSETKDEITTETQIHTVPVGLVMNVTAQIDKHDEVMLNVRPTLSRILGFVDDPNPELASADVKNSVPEIQVREMESMLRVKSGDMAIIGGLMQEIQNGNDRSLPGLSNIPVLGGLFRQKTKSTEQTELLIVLKPTVLDSKHSAPLPIN